MLRHQCVSHADDVHVIIISAAYFNGIFAFCFLLIASSSGHLARGSDIINLRGSSTDINIHCSSLVFGKYIHSLILLWKQGLNKRLSSLGRRKWWEKKKKVYYRAGTQKLTWLPFSPPTIRYTQKINKNNNKDFSFKSYFFKLF